MKKLSIATGLNPAGGDRVERRRNKKKIWVGYTVFFAHQLGGKPASGP